MINKYLLLVISSLACSLTIAATAPAWEIIPAESTLTFRGIQNNAPTTGKFKKFSGDINFDPDQLNASQVRITVDMNSVSTPYADLTETLKAPDWFNVTRFPQAIFEATLFSKIADKKYRAQGTLRIRDKTVPITLSFTEEENTTQRARVKGNTIIKRNAFGIGQGEWANTDNVKDDVEVNFALTALKKPLI